MRHYVNLDKTEPKLRNLLATFRLGTLSQAIEHHLQAVATQTVAPDSIPESGEAAEGASPLVTEGQGEAAPEPLVA
jgi:hypothetical protein